MTQPPVPKAVPLTISPAGAHERLTAGAILVDIRDGAERAQRIPGAIHASLSMLADNVFPAGNGQQVIFHCRSGRRTSLNAVLLCEAAPGCEVLLMDGGIEGWMAAGLPVEDA